jgi:O-antigen/teichoic acid export membrane protein
LPNIKKNISFSLLLSFSQVLLPLFSIPFISRVLTPEGIGKVGFIDSFSYYFVTIAEFGIAVYGTREIVRYRHDKEALRQLVSELIVLHLISSAITIILYTIAVFFLWYKINDIRLLLFSFSFLLVNSFACEWYFMGTEKFKYITIRSLITRLAGLASMFFLLSKPSDYYIYYGIIVVAACGNGIWNTFNLFRELPVRFKGLNWKKHIRYTLVTYSISLLYSATIMLDNVLLGLASTAAAVAFYSFTLKMVRISGLLLSDSLLVFFPKIVSLLKEEKREQMQELLLRNVQFIIFFSVPLSVGLFLLSDELVNIYLGKSFSTVAFNLKIVAAFPFLKLLSLFISKQVLIANNKEKLSMLSLLAGCIALVTLMPILSFYFASGGACIAIMITELVILLMNCYYAKKMDAGLRIFDLTCFLKSCAGVLVFIPIIFLLKKYTGEGILFLLLSLLTCFMLYIFLQLFVLRNNFAIYLNTIIVQYLSKRKMQ